MDIIPRLTLSEINVDLKASFASLKLKQKFFIQLFLVAIIMTLLPHESALAFTIKAPTAREPILVFDTSDKAYQEILYILNSNLLSKTQNESQRQEAIKRGKLSIKIKDYLTTKKSPLAEYSNLLINTPNWKRIVALSNAESGMCKNYPVQTANCWGVGGANLWDMGTNLGDGIAEMNDFLSQYPLRSKVKYFQMTFKQMNGLYKQPAAPHWLYNVQVIYDELTAIENSI